MDPFASRPFDQDALSVRAPAIDVSPHNLRAVSLCHLGRIILRTIVIYPDLIKLLALLDR